MYYNVTLTNLSMDDLDGLMTRINDSWGSFEQVTITPIVEQIEGAVDGHYSNRTDF